ncbi:MAG: flavin reductase family protein [Kiritimatiellaeota bacterium]|nr:flavin reductase family protein [Kiritimatiellota bacterium]
MGNPVALAAGKRRISANHAGGPCRRKRAAMKIKMKAKNCLYPMPVVLVGVEGHQTSAGIRANQTFSVNLPSALLVREVDLCGMVSDRHADKSKLFATFYGELKTAPMVEQCPVNMECRLVQSLDFPKHEVFIGEIVATHGDPAVMPNGLVDFARVNPLLFVMEDRGYWQLGPRLATAWEAGKALKPALD